MAVNGITSGKAPRTRRRGETIQGVQSHQGGDRILEAANGEMGRLADIGAGTMAGISVTTKDRLLRQGGIKVRRND
jgi:hypothetical protein